MNTFISCDWGTSAFRLRLIDVGTKTVLCEVKTSQGIADIYNNWNNQNRQPARFSFYSRIILESVKSLEQQCEHSLQNNTIIVSGMASSSIGMIDLPYKEVPFRCDGADLITEYIAATNELPYNLLFVSGAKTKEDVMRGEETKLIGCMIDNEADQLLIFPGTHSKHIEIKKGNVSGFKTYMTGELFNLLSAKSILSSSVENDENDSKENSLSFFTKGVTEAADSNLLNSIFHVRTYRLFDHHSAQQNYHYLSGLLMGTELKDLAEKKYNSITLVSTGVLAENYNQALQTLGFSNIKCIDADDALIWGQSKLFMQNKR